MASSPAFLFDLDGTLIDSVYQHVIAWREALEEVGINLAVWKIHRRIGMSGGCSSPRWRASSSRSSTPTPSRGCPSFTPSPTCAGSTAFARCRARPGCWPRSSEHHVPWAIATSGVERYARRGLELLELPADTPLITRDQVRYAKPDPDLFLTAAERIGVDIRDSIVVGDSVWDLLAARRARALGIGLLSGGYGREELIYAGAFRVYEDPGDLLAHLDEVGVRRPL